MALSFFQSTSSTFLCVGTISNSFILILFNCILLYNINEFYILDFLAVFFLFLENFVLNLSAWKVQ